MWIFILISVVCIAIVGYMCHTAPVGYQDNSGFHYGTPSKSDMLKTKQNKV